MPKSYRSGEAVKLFFTFSFLLFGIILFTVGFFADSLGLGKSHSSGLGPLEKFCIGAGVLTILIWIIFRKNADVLGINLWILLVMILLLDPLLYYVSPWLPNTLVGRMSVPAQRRYARFHQGGERYTFYMQEKPGHRSDPCFEDWSGRPNTSGFEYTYSWNYDEFGYRNPPGYVSKYDPEVILIGDSFVEGVESPITIAEFLRDYLKPLKIYSTGICNTNPGNWACQYRRYTALMGSRRKPAFVVLNLTGVNDFSFKIPVEKEPNPEADTDHEPEAEAASSQLKLTQDSEGGEGIFMNLRDENSRLPFKNEVFIVLEKYTQEILIKILLQPQKYRVLDKLFHVAGIDGSAWVAPLKYFITPSFDQINWDKFRKQLTAVKEVAQTDYPGTKIILSYIPVRTDICDASIRKGTAVDCDVQSSNQQKISDQVRKICEEFNINYIDITPELRDLSQKMDETLYMPNGHFTVYGYDLYAKFLARHLKDKISKEK